MPLALASRWVSLVRVLYEHGNEDPFWFCSPLAFLWPVLLFLQCWESCQWSCLSPVTAPLPNGGWPSRVPCGMGNAAGG